MTDPAENSRSHPDGDCGSVENIICIHGLWMRGPEMVLLRRRLRRNYGFRVHQFSYPSLSAGLDEHMAHLRRFIEELDVDQVHIVAHSLGGVIALQTLQRYPDLPIRRVVCLGSPLVDSRPGRIFNGYSWGQWIVGRTLIEAIFENPLGTWDGSPDVGVIAGTVRFGVGMLIAKLEKPHDGVVSCSETRLPGISGHVEMRVNHFGLVTSKPVVEQVVGFLRTGVFLPS